MLLLLITGHEIVSAQDIHTGNCYVVMEMEYCYKHYDVHHSKSYYIIELSAIDSLHADSAFCDEPCIAYEITKNGGYYVEDIPTDIYTQACCSSGNIEYSMSSVDSIDAMNGRKDSLSRKHYFVMDILKPSKCYFLNYPDSIGKYTGEYKLRFWLANVDYCVCDIYMDDTVFPLYSNRVAYVTKVYNVQRLNKSIQKRIKAFIETFNF